MQNSGIVQSPIGQLAIKENWAFLVSWTHYQILMRIENDDERTFYEQEAYRSAWSVKMLKRQYNSSLYERIVLSRDKEDVMRLANEGNVPYEPKDILHTPKNTSYTCLIRSCYKRSCVNGSRRKKISKCKQGEYPVSRVGPYVVQLGYFKACHKL